MLEPVASRCLAGVVVELNSRVAFRKLKMDPLANCMQKSHSVNANLPN